MTLHHSWLLGVAYYAWRSDRNVLWTWRRMMDKTRVEWKACV